MRKFEHFFEFEFLICPAVDFYCYIAFNIHLFALSINSECTTKNKYRYYGAHGRYVYRYNKIQGLICKVDKRDA